jgi:hypothetical protein
VFRRDAALISMPEPSVPLALLASMRLSFDSSTEMPLALERTSLPRTRLLCESSSTTPGPVVPLTRLNRIWLPRESATRMPPAPPLIVFASTTLLLDGSSSSPMPIAEPRLLES